MSTPAIETIESEERFIPLEELIETESSKLEEFLSSQEGKAVLELLENSNQPLELASLIYDSEDPQERPYGHYIYVLTSAGIVQNYHSYNKTHFEFEEEVEDSKPLADSGKSIQDILALAFESPTKRRQIENAGGIVEWIKQRARF